MPRGPVTGVLLSAVIASLLVVVGVLSVLHAIVVVVIVVVGSFIGLRPGGGGPRDGSPPVGGGPGNNVGT